MHLQPESDRSLKENQMTLDLSKLWDYNKPDVSEQRFRAALAAAYPDEQLILQTQIARTYGLRQDFARAQEILAAIEPQVQSASAEAQTRYFLELGRTYASTTHPPESQTSEALEKAKSAYLSAFGIAETAKLDNLAIDALHMMVVVETTPEDQLAWNMAALGYMEKSTQSDARKWEGSLRNNIGYALHLQGRYEEALAQFQLALAAHERSGNRPNILVAHWMIAWTLRSLGRLQEAVEIQLRLEREWDKLGEPDPYVFEELEHLYRALGDAAVAEHYAQRRQNPV
jgi:tetratricopeptide (TPR) repeat protein